MRTRAPKRSALFSGISPWDIRKALGKVATCVHWLSVSDHHHVGGHEQWTWSTVNRHYGIHVFK